MNLFCEKNNLDIEIKKQSNQLFVEKDIIFPDYTMRIVLGFIEA